MRKLRHASSLTRWAIPALLIGLVWSAIPRVIAPSALTPALQAFGGLTDEAVAVWQHRDANSTSGWDPWYSVLGRPSVGDPTTSLAWHAVGGPAPEAAPIATLAGDDKNPHVSVLGGATPGTLSTATTAVWQHAAATGSAPGDWDIYYSTINPDGTWAPAALLNHVHGDDYDPNVAVASNGNALAVWVHRDGINDTTPRTLYYSVRTGGSWSTPAAVGPTNGQVSLPEVTLTSVSSSGPLGSLAVAVWADVTPPLTTRQMFYSVFNGVSWTAPAQIPTEVPVPAITDVGHVEYVGSTSDPYGAFGRAGITADGLGVAYVLWGGGPNALSLGSAGVVGAFFDLNTNTWTPMLTPFGARFIGVGGCENPDDAMTTATGDFDGVFNFAGIIEDTFRTGGFFTPESSAWNSELTDFRPSNAGLSTTEMVGVNYGSAGSSFGPHPSPNPLSDIIFSIATINPGIDAAWGPAAHLVPGGLPGEDYFPEVSSAFAAEIAQPEFQLILEPAFDENPVGTPHTLTATVTADGAPQNGVLVSFTVSPSGGSTPTPATGSCVTGTSGPGQCQFTYTSFTTGTDTITATAVVDGVTLTATATKVWFSEAVQEGRITGGALFDDGTNRVTYGFSLHCDETMLPNTLQVNWEDPVTGKHRSFHMPRDGMLSANCSNDPLITPDPPPGDPLANDTHDGLGTGRLDGQPGATASWTLKDAGEPGGSDQGGSDFVHFHINDPGGATVLSIDGKIKRGNHQFHNK